MNKEPNGHRDTVYESTGCLRETCFHDGAVLGERLNKGCNYGELYTPPHLVDPSGRMAEGIVAHTGHCALMDCEH